MPAAMKCLPAKKINKQKKIKQDYFYAAGTKRQGRVCKPALYNKSTSVFLRAIKASLTLPCATFSIILNNLLLIPPSLVLIFYIICLVCHFYHNQGNISFAPEK